MSTLPDARQQNPECGVCYLETELEGDRFVCDDCGLAFNVDDLSASFFYSDALPCGESCDNWWHGDNKIKPGQGFLCGACKLPTGHRSMCWTGCIPIKMVTNCPMCLKAAVIDTAWGWECKACGANDVAVGCEKS